MSDQLVMDLPTWPDQPRRSAWAVQVNEIHVNLYGSKEVSSWWHESWRLQPASRSRICIERATLAGQLVHLHCKDEPHARWLHAHLLDRGLAKAALKVQRAKSCREVAGDE